MIKNCKAFGLLVLLAFSVSFISCDDDDMPDPNNFDTTTVTDFLLHSNGLKITLLIDDNDDETSYFDSYVFIFNQDGTVVATNNAGSISGTYTVIRDDGKVELLLNFPDNPPFDELNDDWYVVTIDQNTIRLDDDGDILEFQKL
jgi:hypothetical protein